CRVGKLSGLTVTGGSAGRTRGSQPAERLPSCSWNRHLTQCESRLRGKVRGSLFEISGKRSEAVTKVNSLYHQLILFFSRARRHTLAPCPPSGALHENPTRLPVQPQLSCGQAT